MLSPGFVQIAGELHISVNTLAQSTAWLILTIGLSLFLLNPVAKVWGRRPVFIVAILIMFASSVWGAVAKDYDSFLASRIIGGIGMAPYEVLVQCTIGDLYFVHQRATRIAAWNMFLLSGIAGGSLISGYIIQVSRPNTTSSKFLTDSLVRTLGGNGRSESAPFFLASSCFSFFFSSPKRRISARQFKKGSPLPQPKHQTAKERT
jgi:MFS family permease